MGQQFGLGLRRFRKSLRQDLCNPLMILPSGVPQQRLIGCLLNQGMLEHRCRLRRHAALVQEFGIYELPQRVLQRPFVPRCDRPEQRTGKRLPQPC